MDSRDRFAPDATPLLAYLTVLRDQPAGDAVAYAIVRGLLAPYGAEMAMIYAARPDGRILDLVGSHGLGHREVAVYSIVTSDMHLPALRPTARARRSSWRPRPSRRSTRLRHRSSATFHRVATSGSSH